MSHSVKLLLSSSYGYGALRKPEIFTATCSWPTELICLVDTSCKYEPIYFKLYQYIFISGEKIQVCVAQAGTQRYSPNKSLEM